MRVLAVGDTHGNKSWLAHHIIPYAVRNECEAIFQVGDFGFVWPFPNLDYSLTKLSRLLVRRNLKLYFLAGNHDDHTKLRRFGLPGPPLWHGKPRDENGHLHIKPNLIYVGRSSAWTWGERRVIAVSGAASIDKDWRIEHARGARINSKGLRVYRPQKPVWWPEEILSPDEKAAALALGRADVLFTHDAPESLPMEGLVPDLDSAINRSWTSVLGRSVRPVAWLHGHYHRNMTYWFRHDSGMCTVYSLACDGAEAPAATRILEL